MSAEHAVVDQGEVRHEAVGLADACRDGQFGRAGGHTLLVIDGDGDPEVVPWQLGRRRDVGAAASRTGIACPRVVRVEDPENPGARIRFGLDVRLPDDAGTLVAVGKVGGHQIGLAAEVLVERTRGDPALAMTASTPVPVMPWA
ncbi:MAG TPA: hypothetical protein VET27_10120 [Mycobacterium sp.]|nr:hypothetical protein [Mycobacterium sp.]